MIVVQRQVKLFEIVGTLRAAGRFPGGLHCRQEQRDEDADDGDHHKQLN